MTFVASLILSTLPQVFPGGDIKLPPKSPTQAVVTPQRTGSEVERFRRDLAELAGPDAKVEARLQQMAAAYAPAAMESLIVEVARSARAAEMTNLMIAARRFGTSSPKTSAKIADELLFQLLSRPMAEATRPVIETMVSLKGPAAKAALQECVRGHIAGVRRHATEVMVPLLVADDLPFALALTREPSLDLQLRGIDLLRALPDERSAQRLVELLSKDPTLAGSACQALVAMRAAAVPSLQKVLEAPAIDRGYAYAAFALAEVAAVSQPEALPESLAAPLAARLQDPELLTRSLVAIPLADLSYRGAPGLSAIDGALVEALLDVVQPLQFLPNLDQLRRAAEPRLQRTTGRLVTAEGLAWRAWWVDQKSGFSAVHARVAVDASNAGAAIVTWRQEQRCVRLLAEGLADATPVAGATEVVLTTEQMLELVTALQNGGLVDEAVTRFDSALPRVRSLQVQVPNARAQIAMPVGDFPRFDALVALVQARLDEESWQLFRNPKDEPERGAYWRAERRWREANPGALERGRRFARRAINNWATLTPALRARAIDQMLANPERKQLLVEDDGQRALAVLGALPELTDVDLRLLELAAAVPGEACWRGAVDVATRTKGGGRAAVRAVFAVVGPDAVVQALGDANPLVRRAGIDEVMVTRDQRASARIVELLADSDADVRRSAAAACGHLQIASSARPLVDAIAAENTPPEVRQECLRSLGRVGGELAFPVLQRALLAKGREDKEAAMRGLGDLRDPRAAHVLADQVVIGQGKDLGALAKINLQRQPAKFAVPALRAQIDIVRDGAIRNDLVLLIGSYQDPASVPDLIDLLPHAKLGLQAADLLESTTGLSFANAQDRVDLANSWYRKHHTQPQSQWLLDALAAANTPSSLRTEQFTTPDDRTAVEELARLLVEVREPRLWALTGAVLRTLTGEDFGVITQQTNHETRAAIAARYRVLFETKQAAQGR
jgi:hypothetical protein